MKTLPENLEQHLLKLVQEKLIETGAPLTAETDLFSVGLDSMGIMQLMISIEETLEVRVPESQVTRDNFTSANCLAALVRRVASGA
jgi:acyl carrier protein